MYVELLLSPLPLVVRRRLLDYSNVHDAASQPRARSENDATASASVAAAAAPTLLSRVAVDPVSAMWEQELLSVKGAIGGAPNLAIVPHWLEAANPPIGAVQQPQSLMMKMASSRKSGNSSVEDPVLNASLFLPAPLSQLTAHLESNCGALDAASPGGAGGAARLGGQRSFGGASSFASTRRGPGSEMGIGAGHSVGGGSGGLHPVLLPTCEEMAIFLAPRDPRLVLQRKTNQMMRMSSPSYGLRESSDALFRDLQRCPALMNRLCDDGQSVWLSGTRAPFTEPLRLSQTLLERFCSCIHLALQHTAMTAAQLRLRHQSESRAAATEQAALRTPSVSASSAVPARLVPAFPLALIGPSRLLVCASFSDDAPPHFSGPLADFLAKCLFLGRARRPLYGEAREMLTALFALGGVVPSTTASGRQTQGSSSNMFKSSFSSSASRRDGSAGGGGGSALSSGASSAASSRSGSVDSAAPSVASSAQKSHKSGVSGSGRGGGRGSSSGSAGPFSGSCGSHPHSASHATLPPPPVHCAFANPVQLSDMFAGVADILPSGAGSASAASEPAASSSRFDNYKMTESGRIATSLLAAAHATVMRASGVSLPMPQSSLCASPSLDLAHRTLLVARHLLECLSISSSSASCAAGTAADPAVPLVLRCDIGVERRRTFLGDASAATAGKRTSGGGGGANDSNDNDAEAERVFGVACRWVPEMLDIRSVLRCIADERRPTLEEEEQRHHQHQQQQRGNNTAATALLPTLARKPLRPLALRLLHILTEVCAVRPLPEQQQADASPKRDGSIYDGDDDGSSSNAAGAAAVLFDIATHFGSDYAEVLLESLLNVLHLAADLELAAQEAESWRASKRQVLLPQDEQQQQQQQMTVAFCEVMKRDLHRTIGKGTSLDAETTALFVAHLLDDGLSLEALQSRLRAFAADAAWSTLLWIFDAAQVWVPVQTASSSSSSGLKPRKPVPHRISLRFLSAGSPSAAATSLSLSQQKQHRKRQSSNINSTGAAILESLFEDEDLDELPPMRVLSDFDGDPVAAVKRRLLHKRKPASSTASSSPFASGGGGGASFGGREDFSSNASFGGQLHQQQHALDTAGLLDTELLGDDDIDERLMMLEHHASSSTKHSSTNAAAAAGAALSAAGSASFGPLMHSTEASMSSFGGGGGGGVHAHAAPAKSGGGAAMSREDALRHSLLVKFSAATAASRKNLMPSLRATHPLYARILRITPHENARVFLHQSASSSAASSALLSDEQLISAGTWNLWTAETRERLLAVNTSSVLNFVRAPKGRMLLNGHFVATTVKTLWGSGITAGGASNIPSTETAPASLFFVSRGTIAAKCTVEPVTVLAPSAATSHAASAGRQRRESAQSFAAELSEVFGYPLQQQQPPSEEDPRKRGRGSAKTEPSSASFCAVDQARNEQLRAMQFLWRNVVGLRAACQSALVLDVFLAQFWVLVVEANWRRVEASWAEVNGTAAGARSSPAAALSEPLLLDRLYALEEQRIVPTAFGGYNAGSEPRNVRRSPRRAAGTSPSRRGGTQTQQQQQQQPSRASPMANADERDGNDGGGSNVSSGRSRGVILTKALQRGFHDFRRRCPVEAAQWIAATVGMTFTKLSSSTSSGGASALGHGDDDGVAADAAAESFTPAETRLADIVLVSARHGTVFINGFDAAATLGFARKSALADSCAPLIKSRFLAAAMAVRAVAARAAARNAALLATIQRFAAMQLAQRSVAATRRRRFIEARSHEIQVSAVLEQQRDASMRRHRAILGSPSLLGSARELALERSFAAAATATTPPRRGGGGGGARASSADPRSPELLVEVQPDGSVDGSRNNDARLDLYRRRQSPLSAPTTPRSLRPSLLDLAEAAHLETPLDPRDYRRLRESASNNNSMSGRFNNSSNADGGDDYGGGGGGQDRSRHHSLSPPRASSAMPPAMRRAYQRALSRSIATVVAVEVAERQRLVEREAMDSKRIRDSLQDMEPTLRLIRSEGNSRAAVVEKWVFGFADVMEGAVEPFFRHAVVKAELLRRRYLRAMNHNVGQTVLLAEEARERRTIEDQQARVALFLQHHSVLYDLMEQLQEMLHMNTDARARFEREVATAAQMKVSALLSGTKDGGGKDGAAAAAGGGGGSVRASGGNSRVAAVVRQAVQHEREPLHVRVQRSVYMQEAECLRSVLDFVPQILQVEDATRQQLLLQCQREGLLARELATRRRLERGCLSFVRRYAVEFQLFLLPITERDLRQFQAALSALYYTDLGKRFIVQRNEIAHWEQIMLAERHQRREIDREATMWDTLFDDSYASPMRLLDALERDRQQIRRLMDKVRPVAQEQQTAGMRASGLPPARHLRQQQQQQAPTSPTAFQQFFDGQQQQQPPRRPMPQQDPQDKIVYLSGRAPAATSAAGAHGYAGSAVGGGRQPGADERFSLSRAGSMDQHQNPQQHFRPRRSSISPQRPGARVLDEMSPNSRILSAAGAVARPAAAGGSAAAVPPSFLFAATATGPSSSSSTARGARMQPMPGGDSAAGARSGSAARQQQQPTRVLQKSMEQQLLAEVIKRRAAAQQQQQGRRQI